MKEQEAIEIINDVTWKDFGRHPDFPEARDMAISALEKQIAKKAIPTPEHCYYAFKCPVCDKHYAWSLRHEFCDCGQRLDFKEIKFW